jgi:hypothetical protein
VKEIEMTIAVESVRSGFSQRLEDFDSIISKLEDKGYAALIYQAKGRFLESFGEAEAEELQSRDIDLSDLYLEHGLQYRRSAIRSEDLLPLSGDLFYPPEAQGVLYVTLWAPVVSSRRRLEEATIVLEAGYIGESTETECLKSFIDAIGEVATEGQVSLEWSPYQPASAQFAELAEDEKTRFLPAADLAEGDIELAQHLEDARMRDLALIVKRSGGILANDLVRKATTEADDTRRVTELLSKVGLLSEEYVIICRRTSNQINRVGSREAIDAMAELNVMCSCGRPITEERVEELIVPTPELKRMLDQSFWMTAGLLRALKQAGVSEDHILLNLLDGAQEIDAFVDLDGSLLMFELKDSEFSMGHAYPFGGRIGLYKPDIAIIVSTSGIAREVVEYFNRVEPVADLVYVPELGELDRKLADVVNEVRSASARVVLSRFDDMATVRLPLADMLARRIGIGPGRATARPRWDGSRSIRLK